MQIIQTKIPGLVIIEPDLFGDERGYFSESYNEKWFKENVADVDFVQDNESSSCYGVVRGLHFQSPPYAQAKLVRCVRGAVLDIALDIRKGSPTYGQHASVILSGNNHVQFFIPKGFAHGFVTLTDDVLFQYKCDDFYNKQSEGGVSILDESLCDVLHVPMFNIIISEKDKQWPMLKDFASPFEYEA